MTRARIPGTLSIAAMKALSALRRADIVDSIEARPQRPVDRLDFLREARRLLAEGATVADVAFALGVPATDITQLLGPPKRRKRRYRTAETAEKAPELP